MTTSEHLTRMAEGSLEPAYTRSFDQFAFQNWAIQSHADTNHFYDEYLPYRFHLEMADKAGHDFKDILLTLSQQYNVPPYYIKSAIWGHDLIEDVRVNYNDVIGRSNEFVAEIIRAVTNYGRGRNRAERMPDFVYEDIRNTPGAVFTKFTDRIANVRYSKMMGSKMFKKYGIENEHFIHMLEDSGEFEICKPMVDYISQIFNS